MRGAGQVFATFGAMFRKQFLENVRMALHSIRGQILRTVLTSAIIAIGIMALVGILTAIDAIKTELTGNFALLGANTFTVQNRAPNVRIGRDGKEPKNYPEISFYEASAFAEKMRQVPQAVPSLSNQLSGQAKLQYRNRSTNPNVDLMGVDDNYLKTAGYEMARGRNINRREVQGAAPVAVIGADVAADLFGKNDPQGEVVSVGGKRYRVIGVLQSKGNSFGRGGDNTIWIPISTARQNYSAGGSYAINVMSTTSQDLPMAVGEAKAAMRAVRKLPPRKESNFHVIKSDNLSQTLIENLSSVSLAAMIIAVVTLLGAAIALMNIMLVSVTERTREIGIRKAIGAGAGLIRSQFLTEAVVICLLGGAGGIVLGIAIGNGTSALIGGSFIIPWNWMGLAVLLCLVVGLLSGFYPAYRASRLDPIEALRYE
ncbi:MAG: ABC transporter permease [Schleiferiaceae bacterium]|nr:ABC transporter permease [Schleiferiaceae bacterium]